MRTSAESPIINKIINIKQHNLKTMTQKTLETIKKLRLWGMARVYETSLENARQNAISADELVGMLVEAEWDDRQNRNLERRLRNARFRYQSCMESIDYQADRNLDRGQLIRFAECNYIAKHENIIITGSTGIGKSFIATALGHQACTFGFKVYYANLGKLFSRLKMGKADGSYLVYSGGIDPVFRSIDPPHGGTIPVRAISERTFQYDKIMIYLFSCFFS